MAVRSTDSNSTASESVSSGDTTKSAQEAEADSDTLSSKFNNLSSGSKIAIFACSGAAALGLAVYAIFYCWRQRRRGAQEANLAAKRMEDERLEMEGYKAAGINPDGFSEATPEYDPKTGMATRDVQVSEYGTAMGGAASRPLLAHAASGSPPGTPGENHVQNPYSDGFSPIDQDGFGHLNHQSPVGMPPSGPLPGVPGTPNRSFSSPNPQMRSDSVGPVHPERSFTNPNGYHAVGDGQWR